LLLFPAPGFERLTTTRRRRHLRLPSAPERSPCAVSLIDGWSPRR
jgi:hypothetical protein